jgi:hypothetical protein
LASHDAKHLGGLLVPTDFKKKTVVLPRSIDVAIREIQAMLIRADVDATYSAAVNFLLVVLLAALARGEVTQDSWRAGVEFAVDDSGIDALNLQARMGEIIEGAVKQLESAVANRGASS